MSPAAICSATSRPLQAPHRMPGWVLLRRASAGSKTPAPRMNHQGPAADASSTARSHSALCLVCNSSTAANLEWVLWLTCCTRSTSAALACGRWPRNLPAEPCPGPPPEAPSAAAPGPLLAGGRQHGARSRLLLFLPPWLAGHSSKAAPVMAGRAGCQALQPHAVL
jgi:hypothetical protein